MIWFSRECLSNGEFTLIFSSKEIANLKNEIEKRQKESDSILENQEAVEKIISSTRDEAIAAEAAATVAENTTLESIETKTS